jgi:hypothetical protein
LGKEEQIWGHIFTQSNNLRVLLHFDELGLKLKWNKTGKKIKLVKLL